MTLTHPLLCRLNSCSTGKPTSGGALHHVKQTKKSFPSKTIPSAYLLSTQKRILDIAAAVLLVLLCSPLMLAIMSAIYLRCKKGEKVIYWSERIGYNGSMISLPKFRTMVSSADQSLEKLLKNNPLLRAQWREHAKLQDDPRILPGMKWVRLFSLDELPQLFLVLTGTLSLVGPRPFEKKFFSTLSISESKKKTNRSSISRPLKTESCENRKLQTKFETIASDAIPGITGLWQISGRSTISLEKRYQFDRYYCNRASLMLDIVILIKTIHTVLLRKGAA